MIKKLLLLLSLPLFLWSSAFHNNEQIKQISSSVVKIYTTSVETNYVSPWQKDMSSSSTGTGVIIDDHLILTAAHVVSDGTFIQVKERAMTPKNILLK